MGQSGSGKTTLLNIIGTLDQPDSGQLTILGNNAMEMSDKKLSELRNQDLGFVFQFHHLLPEFTAFENVLMPAIINNNASAKEELADELFYYVHLSDRKDHLPAELSGGERLRVAVLRALINQPALVLADEPTGNLDINNAKRLLQLFKKINSDFNQTFIITTHNPQVAAIGSRKLKMVNGRLRINK
jgi:lipoprotein-releasing system ATP-binding protein